MPNLRRLVENNPELQPEETGLKSNRLVNVLPDESLDAALKLTRWFY